MYKTSREYRKIKRIKRIKKGLALAAIIGFVVYLISIAFKFAYPYIT